MYVYDYELNPNQGLLLYSDYPLVLDALAVEDLKTTIHLYVLNFKTNQRKIIKTSIGKEFHPKWITNDILEFDSPTTGKREQITYK